MEIRFEHGIKETAAMQTEELRSSFLVDKLMQDDKIQLVYSHYDRVIVGGAKPVNQKLFLDTHAELRADYFLLRRELGIINVGGKGKVTADDVVYELDKLDCLYVGKGIQKVFFESADATQPAVFYLLSSPAHAAYPVQVARKAEVENAVLGSLQTSNERTIYRYIHENGLKSCQLVMGLTILNTGSVWNTMPAHTHTRRMEAYFYFDVADDQRVFHFMGQPQQTRHIVVANHEAVISPSWSIHAGCGTSNYGFIWGMAGENYTYSDMDAVAIADLK
ncbi:5-dehydro-4-deoxy-D-glucuronate isomerase [Parafilimonas terrae]|uniref:4-deoxy-L-threo-5-hexosulose-uronate ketol-isomerase n=1 Tax=Parafilimonas terrae TaxID=1465490 RepID=A0A1I5TTE8_9BACT|nr:5-dehydro-4-deoxy-D-glucuronate isomerase [Parafilimonas terrae]SFP86334.1 4-deoxy-L-threo-5-hexulose uronate isomerase [Parafilimonas terrae]